MIGASGTHGAQRYGSGILDNVHPAQAEPYLTQQCTRAGRPWRGSGSIATPSAATSAARIKRTARTSRADIRGYHRLRRSNCCIILAVGTTEELAFYAAPGPLTRLATDADPAGRLTDPGEVARLLHGLVLHEAWASMYGVEIASDRRQELQLRPAADMLERIRQLDRRPLGEARPPEQRLVGICRDFSVLACALLRHAGVPARARCGFGTYFERD